MGSAERERERSRRVLVVEDDASTLALLKRKLEQAGYRVDTCANGKEAVSILNQTGADIILSDWETPEMTGIELCRVVSELRDSRALGLTYFIIITSHTERSKALEAFEAGADDFVRKPLDFQELLARIRAAERTLGLQAELVERQFELSKSNAQLAVLNRKLKRLANTDMLTTLPNRRRVLDRLNDVWALAERRGRPFSCIMFDLDHFKRVNDTYGHKAGDVVLRDAARTIRRLTRRYDICGRFGGEEFLIICPDEPVLGAARLAERIRSAVARRVIRCDGNEIKVTASFGASAVRPEHASPDALIVEADAMLYAAKQNGRNQVWFADARGNAHRLEAAAATKVKT